MQGHFAHCILLLQCGQGGVGRSAGVGGEGGGERMKNRQLDQMTAHRLFATQRERRAGFTDQACSEWGTDSSGIQAFSQ